MITFTTGLFAKVDNNPDSHLGFYLISFVVILSPITIARRDYRDISSQLPVTAGEKLSVLLFLYWILFPVCFTVAQVLGELCVEWLLNIRLNPKFYNELNETPVFILCGLFQTLSIITIILYTLVKARNNRILSGIGAGVVTYLCYALISAVLSFVVGFVAAIRVAHLDADNAGDFIAKTLTAVFPMILAAMAAIAVVVLIVFTVKLYKKLNNSGF